MNPQGHPQAPLPQAALSALLQGRKIEAIKLVREAEGIGLKEAKDRVEAYVAGAPMLKDRLAAESSRGLWECLIAVALLAVGAIAFFLLRRS